MYHTTCLLYTNSINVCIVFSVPRIAEFYTHSQAGNLFWRIFGVYTCLKTAQTNAFSLARKVLGLAPLQMTNNEASAFRDECSTCIYAACRGLFCEWKQKISQRWRYISTHIFNFTNSKLYILLYIRLGAFCQNIPIRAQRIPRRPTILSHDNARTVEDGSFLSFSTPNPNISSQKKLDKIHLRATTSKFVLPYAYASRLFLVAADEPESWSTSLSKSLTKQNWNIPLHSHS